MKKTVSSNFLLEVSLAILFIAIGLVGIIHWNSAGSELVRGFNRAFGQTNNIVPLIMAIVELLAGVFILLDMFGVVSKKLSSTAMLVVLVYWIFRMVMNYFVDGFAEPDLIYWLASLAPELVVLAAIWTVFQRR